MLNVEKLFNQISDEDRTRWSQKLDQFTVTYLNLLVGYDVIEFGEKFHAGCWLEEKLRQAGASEDEISNASFGFGQKLVFGKDCWSVAKDALKKWSMGYVEEAGQKLSDQLIEKHLK